MFTNVALPYCPVSFVWLLALFEGLAVPLVAALSGVDGASAPKQPGHGCVAGFLAMFVALILANRWLVRLGVPLYGGVLARIEPLAAAIWNALFLEAIFTMQRLVRQIMPDDGGVAGDAFLGFLSVSGALLFVGLSYRLVVRVARAAAIGVRSDDGVRYRLAAFTEWQWALYAGLYEALAFPIINLWQSVQAFKVPVAIITGVTGGFVAAWIVRIIYNRIPRWRCGFRFTRISRGPMAEA